METEKTLTAGLLALVQAEARTPAGRARLLASLKAAMLALGGPASILVSPRVVGDLAETVTALHLAADHAEFVLEQLTTPAPAARG